MLIEGRSDLLETLSRDDRDLFETCKKFALLDEVGKEDVRGALRLAADMIAKKIRDRDAVNQEALSKSHAPTKQGA